MQRPLLPEDRTDPAIREVIARNHRDIIEEVERAVVAHDVVVVGMKQNPFPRRARKALTAAGGDRKSTRLNSSHGDISHARFCLKRAQIEVTTSDYDKGQLPERLGERRGGRA